VRAKFAATCTAQLVVEQHWRAVALKSQRRSGGLLLTTHGLSVAVVAERLLVGQIRFALSVALRVDTIGFVMSALSVENTWQRKASGR
jgi:hypothetical protein